MQGNFKNPNLKVRFAPAPTGLMHIGNIRTALLNYLIAKQKNGTFVIRIEDTDPVRNFDPDGKKIIEHLNWLGLDYDEGPVKEGPSSPYFQSKRTKFYQEKLDFLKDNNFAYRCFCTNEELEKKRARQIALKKPPRYDGKCVELSPEEIKNNLTANKPFIWRIKVDPSKTITVNDIAKGKITFELKNFSDFPITRQDGSFTFTLANCVDDIEMGITHVFRGEDHLTNSVDQLIIFNAINAPAPTYWHMPLICNKDGKKLSKRDFGFSLEDLKAEGFLPEAINNYLAIMGTSITPEIQNLEQLTKSYPFDNISSSGHIKYDEEKLRWVNHKWIEQTDDSKLAELCLPFLKAKYPQVEILEFEKLIQLIKTIKTDLVTLKESVKNSKFFFEAPKLNPKQISQETRNVINKVISSTNQNLADLIKLETKAGGAQAKIVFPEIRYILTGNKKGPNLGDLIDTLGVEESISRLSKV